MTKLSIPGFSASYDIPLMECETELNAGPVRQGDVFEWRALSDDPHRRLGLIVTADCDIAHAKHAGVLSYVPLMSVQDYLRLYRLPKTISRRLEELKQKMFASVRSHQTDPDFTEPISGEAVLDWLEISSPDAIADALAVTTHPDRERLVELLETYVYVRTALADLKFDTQIEAIVKTKLLSGQKDAAKARQIVMKEVRGWIQELPGDAFFIGFVSERMPEGYIAYLRLVREIEDAQIAVSSSDERHNSSVLARRVARLGSPYLFCLTQRLGSVFGSIGLPGEYEDNRRRITEGLV